MEANRPVPVSDLRVFERFAGHNPFLNLVACRGEEVVGAVMAGHDGLCGHIYHLYASEGARADNVPMLLVDTVLSRLRQEGFVVCFVRKNERNGLASGTGLLWAGAGTRARFSIAWSSTGLASDRFSR
jgi:hypothetical protein